MRGGFKIDWEEWTNLVDEKDTGSCDETAVSDAAVAKASC